MKVTLAVLVLLGVFTPGYAPAREDSLVGIRVVAVEVDSLDNPSGSRVALPGDIQTEVELKLRQNGLRVVPFDSIIPVPGLPYLHVNIGVVRIGRDDDPVAYVYTVRAALFQVVTLVRKPGVLTIAPTWISTGRIGYAGLLRTEAIRDAIRSQVDQFLNAYLAANPKPAGGQR